jgi:hypothetical protein
MTYWKRIFILLGGFALCCSNALAQAQSKSPEDLVLRWHFIGATQLAAHPEAAKLRQILALPAADEFRKEIVEKLAVFSIPGVENRPENRAKMTPLLHPLWEDLLRSESVFEARRGGTEFILAIQLNKERAQLWEKNLRELLRQANAGAPREIQVAGFKGWEVPGGNGRASLQFIRAGQWLVVHRSGFGEEWINRLKQNGRPAEPLQEGWFSGELEVAALKKALPGLALPLKPCRLHVLLTLRDENVRAVVRAVYPEKLNWKHARWQIPTEIIRDPVRSFAAAQGLSALIETPELFRNMGFNPLEHQVYSWSQVFMPFQTFLAISAQNPTNQLKKLISAVPKEMNPMLQKFGSGDIQPGTNQLQLAWHGLPLVLPQLRATNEAAGGFLYGELFPPVKSKEPLPPELIQQVAGRTNLIYYHWEITEDRLSNWQVLSQVLPFFPNERFLGHAPRGVPAPKAKAGQQWLEQVAPLLGNTGTEITLTAPNEVQFVRRSHLGLTGFELVWLTHWILDPAFPGISRPQPGAAPSRPTPRPPAADK